MPSSSSPGATNSGTTVPGRSVAVGRQLGEHVGGARLGGAEADPDRRTAPDGQPVGQVGDRCVGVGPGGPDRVEQDRLGRGRAGGGQPVGDHRGDVVAGAEDRGQHQLDPRAVGGLADGLGDVDPGVERVGEQQRHHHRPTHSGGGELGRHGLQVGVGQIQVGRAGLGCRSRRRWRHSTASIPSATRACRLPWASPISTAFLDPEARPDSTKRAAEELGGSSAR